MALEADLSLHLVFAHVLASVKLIGCHIATCESSAVRGGAIKILMVVLGLKEWCWIDLGQTFDWKALPLRHEVVTRCSAILRYSCIEVEVDVV